MIYIKICITKLSITSNGGVCLSLDPRMAILVHPVRTVTGHHLCIWKITNEITRTRAIGAVRLSLEFQTRKKKLVFHRWWFKFTDIRPKCCCCSQCISELFTWISVLIVTSSIPQQQRYANTRSGSYNNHYDNRYARETSTSPTASNTRFVCLWKKK